MAAGPGRRTVLRASAALAAGTALPVVGGALPAAAAPSGTELPEIPGMLGDRRANELWYLLDQASLYHPSPEFKDAYYALVALYGPGWDNVLLNTWRRMVTAPEYPANFTDFVAPARAPLEVMSQVQLEVFDAVYRPRDPGLVRAFAEFGQGLLYDPRTKALHIMTGRPPGGYPVWHVVMRATMLLGIDAGRWAHLAPLNAFGCAVQLEADPDLEHVNAPLPDRTVRRLAAHWLHRGVRQLDVDFQSFPYPQQP
ncbi:hypothetical protein [Streptomyces sp. NPDC059874]|uniref:hypothetical protein n=1 Tax=Streptomyces sp. NPDC059874 TaxID=3346983 RepID=UPI00366755CF